MAKKRHQKDKLHLIPSEYAESWGGKKAGLSANEIKASRILPFDHCALTLRPLKHQILGTKDGMLFDQAAILTWLGQYKQNPVTGAPLSRADLYTVTFHRNAEGKPHCPITFKEFNENTKILCNLKTGHVYCDSAIDEICRRSGKWLDPMDGSKFTSRDLAVIQDPTYVDKRDIDKFDFVRTNKDTKDATAAALGEDLDTGVRRLNSTSLARRVLDQLKTDGGQLEKEHQSLVGYDSSSSDGDEPQKKKSKPMYSEVYTESGVAASLTSTSVTKQVQQGARQLTDNEVREKMYEICRKKKLKSYVILKTSFGELSVELRSDLVPQTCHNFILNSGLYTRTIFHRIIPGFMAQGGDPEGTGKGGKVAFKSKVLFDEFHKELTHDGRGVLSMANTGEPDTGTSQFFILFKRAHHLDGKHSVFGKVVKGLEVLDKLETVKTNPKTDRPESPPILLRVIVCSSAFAEAEKMV